MYKQNVVPVNVHKYNKATPALLADVLGTEHLYTNVDGYQWICCTCNAALTRGNMPAQAIANGLRLSDVSPELCTFHENGGPLQANRGVSMDLL